MISMSTVNDIRRLRRCGESVSAISRELGISRDSVYKYLRADDLSPRIGPAARRPSKLDPYKEVIDGWLEEDARNWRKQRHTARRIWHRLQEEYGLDVSETTVSRYVKKARSERRSQADGFLDLVWAPGEAQADFGEADFLVRGVRRRLKYFVLVFPHSNMGLAQVMPGENAECVCLGLRRIFERIGGVPGRIVFDNAAGVGRKVCGEVRTTELFGACAAHYAFDFSFCNPRSGNEKGSVENKVGAIRSNLFVPVPRVWSLEGYNARLLDRCMAMSDKAHYAKGAAESELFAEDRLALGGLPDKPFSCARIATARTDKKGKFELDGPHRYSTSPELARATVTLRVSALSVEVYDGNGAPVCKHARAYGDAPTDTTDPASQLSALIVKANGWRNSRVRAALPGGLRDHMDSLGKQDLRAELRLMRGECARTGWDSAVAAMAAALEATGRVDEASVSMAAARAAGGSVEYAEPLDLSEYDRLSGMAKGA